MWLFHGQGFCVKSANGLGQVVMGFNVLCKCEGFRDIWNLRNRLKIMGFHIIINSHEELHHWLKRLQKRLQTAVISCLYYTFMASPIWRAIAYYNDCFPLINNYQSLFEDLSYLFSYFSREMLLSPLRYFLSALGLWLLLKKFFLDVSNLQACLVRL